jgi:GT2 family glycosyltransferase
MKYYLQKDPRIKFIELNIPFNFSRICNIGVKKAGGEYLLLLNNDTEMITPNWIEEMLGHAQREEVGAVGCKLLYPNNTIQHAGVIIGLGGIAGHSHKFSPRDNSGYFCRLYSLHNVSAVTAACLMIKKEKYLEVNGFNEEDLKIAFNDVDFCLRLREKGYLNVFTPFSEIYHHESSSRGRDDSGGSSERFLKETAYMKKRHNKILTEGDPFYNPNLALTDMSGFNIDIERRDA